MTYELIYTLSPKFTDDEAKNNHQKVLASLKENITKVLKDEFWGKKRLAYEIKHFQDGYYFFILFEAEPEKIKQIDRKLKLTDEIIRFLITKKEREYTKAHIFVPRQGIVKVQPPKLEEKKAEMKKVETKKIEKKKPITKTDLDKKLDEILGEEVVD